jgi:biofilm PGA synthesis N-glycosyltransferase PgaC
MLPADRVGRRESAVNYVLITPAKNEEVFLEMTIQSMVRQTVRPLRWVIVSDGSTDRTDAIASEYARQYPWIKLVTRPPRVHRHFSGKVEAFNEGVRSVSDLDFDVIGSLDADLSFVPDYFEFLLSKFADDAQLGIAGTPFEEEGATYDFRFSTVDHVSGACQLFRRNCYEQIGGYVPLKDGGIDVVAVLTARMKGWRTRTFTERWTVHHRPMGSAVAASKFQANYKLGRRAYGLGFHPLWQLFRCFYQMTRRPYVSAGVALGLGYFSAMLGRTERVIGDDVVAFQRRDQMKRLRAFLRSRLFPSPISR